jgi:hypothetical protein
VGGATEVFNQALSLIGIGATGSWYYQSRFLPFSCLIENK